MKQKYETSNSSKPMAYDTLLGIVDLNGYTKHFYGYRKVTEAHTHWITIFEKTMQMYGYENDDADMEKVYDTGIINIGNRQLQHFINVWLLNYA